MQGLSIGSQVRRDSEVPQYLISIEFLPRELPEEIAPLLRKLHRQRLRKKDGQGRPTTGRPWSCEIIPSHQLKAIRVGLDFGQSEPAFPRLHRRILTDDERRLSGIDDVMRRLKWSLNRVHFVDRGAP